MAAIGDAGADLKILGLANEPRFSIADQTTLLITVRRALMSLSRRRDGSVPRLFSGHETDGAPIQSGRHEHIFLAAADLDRDGRIDRLIVGAPWRCDRAIQPGGSDPALFDRRSYGVRTQRGPSGKARHRVIGRRRSWR
jgi:hypothetical protein